MNADPAIRGSKQPFHTAEGMALAEAERFVHRCEAATARMTREELQAVIEDVRARGYALARAGVLLASGRSGVTLEQALSSHAMLHTAEGEFYRNALIQGCEHFGLSVTRVRERELVAQATAALRQPKDVLARSLNEMGEALGPPWTQDEKLASLLAWLVLASK